MLQETDEGGVGSELNMQRILRTDPNICVPVWMLIPLCQRIKRNSDLLEFCFMNGWSWSV